MKFEVERKGTSHKAFIGENDVSNGITGINIDIEACNLTQVTLRLAITEGIIKEDADIFILLGSKKYRIMEEIK